MWLYCHLVVLCWYVSVLLKALKKEKKIEEMNCVCVLFKKKNKVKTVQFYFLFINFTFIEI